MRFRRGRKRKDTQDKDTLMVASEDDVLEASTPDERSFARVYEAVHDRAMAKYEKIVGYDHAHDAMHRASREMFAKWDQLPPERKGPGSLMKAISFRVRDIIRERKDEEPLPEEGDAISDLPAVNAEERLLVPDVGVAYEAQEFERLMDDAAARMPEQARRVFVLLRGGHTQREIAEILDISESTVSRHVARAREEIQRVLERSGYRPTRESALELVSDELRQASTRLPSGQKKEVVE